MPSRTVIQMDEAEDGGSSIDSQSSSGSLSALGRSLFPGYVGKPVLSISVDTPLVYVNPSDSNRFDGRTALSGSVVLTPSPGRRFDALTVTVRGQSSLDFPSGHHEDAVVFERRLRLLIPREARDQSTQVFKWRFGLPSDIAPSYDGPAGRISYSATATTSGGLLPDATTDRAFEIVAIPGGDPLDALVFDYLLAAFSEELGVRRCESLGDFTRLTALLSPAVPVDAILLGTHCRGHTLLPPSTRSPPFPSHHPCHDPQLGAYATAEVAR